MTPNPGSSAALTQGCICAVMDNNHGKYAPFPPDGWWISDGCPLHAADEEEECAGCGRWAVLYDGIYCDECQVQACEEADEE